MVIAAAPKDCGALSIYTQPFLIDNQELPMREVPISTPSAAAFVALCTLGKVSRFLVSALYHHACQFFTVT